MTDPEWTEAMQEWKRFEEVNAKAAILIINAESSAASYARCESEYYQRDSDMARAALARYITGLAGA